MLDPWDEIIVLEKERQSCADDLEAIKASCSKDHGKSHVSQCPECWHRTVSRIRDRYLNPSTSEWFSGRRLFLQELDTMFPEVYDRKMDIKALEQRISEEKNEWFRERVRTLGLQSATKTPAEARHLQQTLNDKTIPVDQLAFELRSSFSDGLVNNKAAFDGFLLKLIDAKSPEERVEAHVAIFFQPSHDPQGAAKCQKYIDVVRNGTPIADVIQTMLRDRQSLKGMQDKKQALQKKIEELKRAKAAHEAGKAKKEKLRQDKAAAAAVPDPNYSIPPCLNCGKMAGADEIHACVSCVVLEDYKAREQKTVFCSQECLDQGYAAHMDKDHECAADQMCIRNREDDDAMEEDAPAPVFCQECLEAGRETIFCSVQCYETNFQRHREWVHLPIRRQEGMDIDDEDQLEFTLDKNIYRPRRIQDHCITMDDAIEAHFQRTGAKRAE